MDACHYIDESVRRHILVVDCVVHVLRCEKPRCLHHYQEKGHNHDRKGLRQLQGSWPLFPVVLRRKKLQINREELVNVAEDHRTQRHKQVLVRD